MYSVKSDKKYRTAKLYTDKDRWTVLERLFKHAKIKDTVFLPDEELYTLPLVDMASMIFEWLGIDSDKRMYVDFSDQIGDAAGLYFESEGTHFILVNTKHQNNRFEAAAILAHELMHFCLMGEFNFKLEETLANERLTDMATIYCGLGIVVLNGFEYSSGWATTAIGLMFGRVMVNTESMSFGYYKPKAFAKMFAYYVDQAGEPYYQFSGYLLPWTRHFLPAKLKLSSKTNKNRSNVVVRGQRGVWKARVIQLLIVIAFIPLAVLFFNWRVGGTSSNIPSDVQTRLTSEQSATEALKAQYESCSADLKVRDASVDTTSQASVDSYNADVATCETTRKDYNQAVESYNALLDQYQ